MVARTINETLMEVEHTPPVHKKVGGPYRRWQGRRTTGAWACTQSTAGCTLEHLCPSAKFGGHGEFCSCSPVQHALLRLKAVVQPLGSDRPCARRGHQLAPTCGAMR